MGVDAFEGLPMNVRDNQNRPGQAVQRINILGVGISAIDLTATMALMVHWIESRQRHSVNVCAVHVVMECQDDPELRAMVNRASLAVPDGMPLVWVSRMLGAPHVGRVYGPDLMLAFCELAAWQGYTNYLLGGAPGQPDVLAKRLISRFPGLSIVGSHATPIRPIPPDENDAIINDINEINPDVVWVGTGAPIQERWIARNRDRLQAPVLIGVGAAFDMHSGVVPQAPPRMQQLGLEWLFRFAQEPGRLWRRYLLGNPRFVAGLVGQRLGLRKYELPVQDHLLTVPDLAPIPEPVDAAVLSGRNSVAG
jgi:N-acetylglucosaminyldiphosphoundecaprenol N-acetyl-beta-D-mannosaminyltransferase